MLASEVGKNDDTLLGDASLCFNRNIGSQEMKLPSKPARPGCGAERGAGMRRRARVLCRARVQRPSAHVRR